MLSARWFSCWKTLHWSDTSSLEWLAYVARRRQPARLLALVTYRPADAAAHEHPVREVAQELTLRGQAHQVAVPYASQAQVEAYLTLRLGSSQLGADLGPHLSQRSHGNMLFLVAIVDELTHHGLLYETEAAGWSPKALTC